MRRFKITKIAVKRGRGRPPVEVPQKTRELAVTTWLQLGSLAQVARVLNEEYSRVRHWKTESWWTPLENEFRISGRVQTGAKIQQIVNKALNVVEDRLENGEVIVVNGEESRKPVALRDAANTAVTLMQRQQVLENQNNQNINLEATKSIQEQLAILAQEFAKFNNRSKAQAETIEFREVTDDADMGEWSPEGSPVVDETMWDDSSEEASEDDFTDDPGDDGISFGPSR